MFLQYFTIIPVTYYIPQSVNAKVNINSYIIINYKHPNI